MLKFGHIELFVRDPSKAAVFYCDVLGFEKIIAQGSDYIWLRLDRTEILLRRGECHTAKTYTEAGMAFVLYTDNLTQTLARLQLQGLRTSGQDGSAKCPVFVDPDGHWFQIVNKDDH
jgi:catechol 2,3-dioxygenase-like lactoylglutathione lyase family enzyme